MGKVTIAVVGLNGFLGKPVLEAIESGKFDDKIEFPVKALSRKDQVSNEKIHYIKTEISDETVPFIVESLKGVDVIIELVAANPDLFRPLEQVVEKVAPKIYIPSQFGVDIAKVHAYSPTLLTTKHKHANAIKNPNVKTIDVVTSLFAQEGSFLYEHVNALGINTEDNTIVQRGDPSTKMSFTKLKDIGFSLISIATLPAEKLPTTLRISSDVVSYQDVFDRYEKTHQVKLTTIKTLTKEESLHELQQKFTAPFDFFEPTFNFGDFLLYVNGVIAQGEGNGAYYAKTDNELINPNESLWKWSKY